MGPGLRRNESKMALRKNIAASVTSAGLASACGNPTGSDTWGLPQGGAGALPSGAAVERAPTIAWLRLWACAEQNAKQFFYGDDGTLCQSSWTMAQRKVWK